MNVNWTWFPNLWAWNNPRDIVRIKKKEHTIENKGLERYIPSGWNKGFDWKLPEVYPIVRPEIATVKMWTKEKSD